MSLSKVLKSLFKFQVPNKYESFVLAEDKNYAEYDVRDEKVDIPKNNLVIDNIENNLDYVKKAFTYPKNSDVVIREFTIGKNLKAFIVFIDGMVDTKILDLAILQPLLQLPVLLDIKLSDVAKTISDKLICHTQVSELSDIDVVIENVNFGCCGLFIDNCDIAFSLDVRDWGHRGIDKPEIEQSIYGPQEAFAEMFRNNTALIRKILKTEKLICESVSIGTISKTPGVIMYISDIVNDSLLNEVRNRIGSITVDYVISIEEIAMMIEDKPYMITNQILSTERPDRTARALTEGRVALLINGSPHALIMPTNAFELTHTASDAYLRFPYANMSRIIRYLAMLFSILLPGLYISVTLFHHEMLPTDLLYSISVSRENVPFPSILEILLMETAFEIIREAGIRMPGPIGSTLSIVGGLILGQAAVSAKIVSPIMIIVIALTGIGSFATTDFSLAWSYRILRLIFILLASFAGLYGVSLGIFIYCVFIASQKSFGVSFLSPVPGGQKGSIVSSMFVKPIFKNEYRPSYLATKNNKQEPKISRKWKRHEKKK